MDRLALAHICNRDYEASIEAAQRVIRTNPDCPHIYRWLAAALGELGRLEEASQALEHLVAIAPASLEVFVRHRSRRIGRRITPTCSKDCAKAGWDK